LFFDGKPIYESTETRESLAFLLYKDGVREIRFLRGLEDQEILDLLDVLRRGEQASRLEDDIVTLLWQKEFAHISYYATDEFMESNAVPLNYDEYQAGLEFSPPAEGPPSEQESTEEEMVLSLAETLPETVRDQRETLASHFQPTPEEANQINQLIDHETDIKFVSTLVDNLIEILLHLGEDLEPYENMVTFFDRALEFLVLKGEFKTAGEILKTLREILESTPLIVFSRVLGAPGSLSSRPKH
jgi:hypothetical protein